jgi:hypothetical protein
VEYEIIQLKVNLKDRKEKTIVEVQLNLIAASGGRERE